MYFLVIVLAWAVMADEDYPYCALRYRRLCQGKGRHVACLFPTPGPGVNCVNYTQIKFTSELRHFITHYINRRRQRIAAGHERVRGGVHLPRPQIMMFVEWDRELASLAQRLADQCDFVHDDCRATVRYPYAGQTVGEVRWRRLSDNDELGAQRAIRRVFDAWWGERRRVDPSQLTQPFRIASRGSVWGHFSQISVWTLRAVGCGAVTHGNEHPRLLLVCDFSHTNMLGQRTITPGKLMPCPDHTRRKSHSGYPLLCMPIHRHSQDSETDEATEVQYEYEDEEEEEEETNTEENIEARTEERAERRTEGRTEGRTERRTEARTERRTERRTETRTERRTTRRTTAYITTEVAVRDEETIRVGGHRRIYNEQTRGHRRMPIEDDEPYEERVERISTVQEEPYAEEITESTAMTPIQDILDFTPVPEASFYKKLAVQLGPGKTDEDRRQLMTSKQKIVDEQRNYRTREQSEKGTEDKYKNKVQAHNRVLENEKRFLGRTGGADEESFENWEPRMPFIDKWREPQEEIYQPRAGPRRPNPTRPVKDSRKTRITETTTIMIPNLNFVRHKNNWKQTRNRPRRPGAAALLQANSPEPPMKTATARSTRVPFLMDEDDVRQLFEDTGFNPTWRKSKPD